MNVYFFKINQCFDIKFLVNVGACARLNLGGLGSGEGGMIGGLICFKSHMLYEMIYN